MTIFHVRLKFHVTKSFSSEAVEIPLIAFGEHLILKPEFGGTFSGQKALVIEGGSFSDRMTARKFGHRLQLMLELSSFETRLGVDVGHDLKASGTNENSREDANELSPMGTGVEVYTSDAFMPLFRVEGFVTVSHPADKFVQSVLKAANFGLEVLPLTQPAVTLMNSAHLSQDTLSRLVLAISAVELLSQDRMWTVGQKALLEELASVAQVSGDIDDEARSEVIEAVNRARRISVGASVRRFLVKLGMADRQEEWKKIYDSRSRLFHGSKHLSRGELSILSDKAVSICHDIVWVAVQTEITELSNTRLDD